MPKLRQEDHTEIYAKKGKESAIQLANRYQVSLTTIYKIWNGLPPTTYKEALHRIKLALESTRGMSMSQEIYDMWIKIHKILVETLEE